MIDAEDLAKKSGNLTDVEDLTLHAVDDSEVSVFHGLNGAHVILTMPGFFCLRFLYVRNFPHKS